MWLLSVAITLAVGYGLLRATNGHEKVSAWKIGLAGLGAYATYAAITIWWGDLSAREFMSMSLLVLPMSAIAAALIFLRIKLSGRRNERS